MELVGQHQLPQAVQRGRRVGPAERCQGQGREQLRLPQPQLALAVELLVARLGGIGAAVHLEIQLAHQHQRVLQVSGAAGKEFLRRPDLGARQAVHIPHAAQLLQHGGGRPTAAVTIAKQQVAFVGALVVFEVADVIQHILDIRQRVIRIDGREMGQHTRAIDALPHEGVAGRLVELVPGQLLGQEIIDPGQFHDLRQRPAVAEHIRVPELPAAPAKLGFEEALPVQELPHQRFARGQVAVRFDPGAAGGDELPAAHLFRHARIQRRIMLLHPFELLCLRTGELVLGVRVHVTRGRGKRAGAFAPGLGQRPQPGGIDMGMPDRRQVVLAITVPGR